MAVDRAIAEDIAASLSRVYGELELEIAEGLARRLQRGITLPSWETDKLIAIGEVRRWVDGLATRVSRGLPTRTRRALLAAFRRGGDAAQRELARVGAQRSGRRVTSVRTALPGAQAIDRLAVALAGQLDGMRLPIIRSTLDAYRLVVASGATTILSGTETRRQAAQKVWGRLLDRGVTRFVDTRGRSWNLAGYVEMATRTATAQAAVQGHLDRLDELGVDLVIVSNSAQECRLCRPWEGKVLTRDDSGRGGKALSVEHATEDRQIRVSIGGSVDEAIAAGLMHPNCRHTIGPYLPGVTRRPEVTADPQGDAARQRLRALERRARSARLQVAGALTPGARAQAQARVKATTGEIEKLVKANDLTRRKDRERINLGNTR